MKKLRVQFDFSEKAIEQLDELKETTGAATRAEVIRNALTLFYEAVTVQSDGGKFGFLDHAGSMRWYVLPGLRKKMSYKELKNADALEIAKAQRGDHGQA